MKRTNRIMSAFRLALVLGALMLPAPVVAQDAAQRVREAFPPQVAERIEAIARSAAAEGAPPGPLYHKALEGAAKRVPPGRIIPAVDAYANRLVTARKALGTTRAPLIVAGADAISRGVSPELLAQMADEGVRRGPRSVLILADLVERGVPTDRALEVVREALRTRQAEADMAAISGTVERMIRNGDAPGDVARRLVQHMRRGLRIRQMRDVPRNMVRDRPGPPVAPGVETVDKKPGGMG
ncbi:MAG: hypothetical protein HKN73_06040 [Gemmatimonadetes bacterium]|nr:hypothetical protein [Gemmatimonadota bacterium]